MSKNVGSMDRIFRIVLAIFIGLFLYAGNAVGTTAYVLGAVAVLLAITAVVNFCPVYRVLGWSTCKKEVL